MARFITEQENNVRSLQAETLKKIAELNQSAGASATGISGRCTGDQGDRRSDQSLENSIDKAVTKFNKEKDGYVDRASRTLLENLRTKYLQSKGPIEDK